MLTFAEPPSVVIFPPAEVERIPATNAPFDSDQANTTYQAQRQHSFDEMKKREAYVRSNSAIRISHLDLDIDLLHLRRSFRSEDMTSIFVGGVDVLLVCRHHDIDGSFLSFSSFDDSKILLRLLFGSIAVMNRQSSRCVEGARKMITPK